MIQSRSKKQRALKKASRAQTAASNSTLIFPKSKSVGTAGKHPRKQKQKFVTPNPCLVCGKSPSDRDHIQTQGAGGPDEDWNLLDLCRRHHQERHFVGIITFVQRHPIVDIELKTKGWEIINDKLYHIKLTGYLIKLHLP